MPALSLQMSTNKVKIRNRTQIYFKCDRIMYWSAWFLFNDSLLPNFSGNIIFYIPLNVLCGATVRNVDFHYLNRVFWKSKSWRLSRQPCWNLLCWLTFFLNKSFTVIVTTHKKWSPKDIKWRIYGHHIFEWRAAKPYEVPLGTVRFCFLCLALLVFSPLLQSAYNFPLFIFIGI